MGRSPSPSRTAGYRTCRCRRRRPSSATTRRVPAACACSNEPSRSGFPEASAMAEPLIVVTAEQLEAVVERAVARALAGVRPAASPADPALVDIDEASRLLGLSTSTVYKLAARCEIPSV